MCEDYFPNTIDVGVYVSFLVACYFIGQFITAFMGTYSDKVGRKPILLFYLSVGFTCVLWAGFSTNYYAILFSRLFLGLGCILPVVTKPYCSKENTDATNQHIAFAILGIAGNVCSFLAPLVSGYLAEPAKVFGGSWDSFWREFPFLLPCLVGSSISLSAFIVVLFFT